MRVHARHGGILAVLVGMVAVSASSAPPPFPFQPESRLWVEGTSTVRSFTCKAGELKGDVDAAPTAAGLEISGLKEAVRGVQVTVPVEALDCGNGTMDSHLYKALKGQEHPTIEYRLTSYDVVANGSAEATVKMTGRLKLAGQERPITIEGVATPAADGALRVRGSKEIVMTEFGVKPPSLMMGTMKVHDRVTVHFDVVLRP